MRDNARIHHTTAFQARLAAWEYQNVCFFWLPTYCPLQQNRIALAQGQIRGNSGRKPTPISKSSWPPFGTSWTAKASNTPSNLRRDTLYANDVFYYAQFQGNLAGTTINRERAAYTLTANSSFTMPNGWSADLNERYESR